MVWLRISIGNHVLGIKLSFKSCFGLRFSIEIVFRASTFGRNHASGSHSKHAPHLKSGRVTFSCTAPGSPDDFSNNNQGLHSLSYQLADRMPECWPFVLKCHLGFLKRWLFLFIYHRFGMDFYGTSPFWHELS